jgi:2-polyprenyl-3-methyl-5-hydroxy-6-metoxy-1,4-benzoquinol methylase
MVANSVVVAKTGQQTNICPVCSGREFEQVGHPAALDLWRCRGCTLLVLQKENDALFAEVEQEYFGEGYLRRQGPLAERILQNKAKQRIRDIARLQPTGKFLDLGCGTGELIGAAKAAGYDVEGLDYSAPLARYVAKKYDVVVHEGESSQVALHERYDVIAMSHVIEHVLQPQATVKSLAAMLKPGGLLYLATPNIDCWEARYRGWGSYEPYHLLYFNPHTIQLLLEQAQFQIVSIRTGEPYSAWLNTALRSALPARHATARQAVHEDVGGKLKLPFTLGMTALNISRLASGFLLTPLRKYQEQHLVGEELIVLARRGD